MIAYKWVVKRGNKYCSLMNFKINSWMKYVNSERYYLNKVYDTIKDFHTNRTYNIRETDWERPGYHCWKSSEVETKPEWNRYHNYFKRFIKRNIKMTILKIEISETDIIKQNQERLIVKNLNQ